MFQTDPFSLIVLFVGLSLLPFVAMIATSYLKIVVVMSLIRNALGIQSIPPNMVINALAMILTFYIMAPVASESWGIAHKELGKQAASASGATQAAKPPNQQPAALSISTEAIGKAAEPFRKFLSDHTSARERAFWPDSCSCGLSFMSIKKPLPGWQSAIKPAWKILTGIFSG